MIAIDFSWSIFIFSCVPVLILMFLWVTPPKKDIIFKALKVRDAVWNCNICTYIYFVLDKKAFISQCPRCGSLNRRKESGPKDSNF